MIRKLNGNFAAILSRSRINSAREEERAVAGYILFFSPYFNGVVFRKTSVNFCGRICVSPLATA